MKLIQSIKLLRTIIPTVTVAVFTAGGARGDTLPVITSGHTDVGVNYEDDAWDLHVHAEDLGEEFAPDGVWIKVGTGARTSVPSGGDYSFLGTEGSSIWVLPATHQEGLVYLGFGTEEMESGIFVDDTVSLALKSVDGPGDFIVYINDVFGNPVVWYNSRDGLDTNDVHSLIAGGHSHVNWVFTAAGKYHLHFQASGVLESTGETTTSEIADYQFDVGELPVITSGHTGVCVNYEDDAWDLHVHSEDLEEDFAPNGVWIKVGTDARTSVPSGEDYSFLGTEGSSVWVLPATRQEGLVYLGISAEDMESGIFVDDTVSLALKSVDGPGDFIVYINDVFGNPVVWYNSRDGLDTNDVHFLTAGGHSHVNWVFTVPGQYHLHFQASGVLKSTGETTTSEIADYQFDVGELPSLQITNNAGAFTLTWSSETNVSYQVQSRTDLGTGDWQNYGDSVSGTGSQISMPLTNKTQCLFFRVEAKYLSTH